MSCGESLVSSVTQTISLRLASGNEARLRGLFSTLPLAGVALPTARSGYSRNLLTITMSALRVNCGANSLFGQLLSTKFSSTRRSRNLQRRPGRPPRSVPCQSPIVFLFFLFVFCSRNSFVSDRSAGEAQRAIPAVASPRQHIAPKADCYRTNQGFPIGRISHARLFA